MTRFPFLSGSLFALAAAFAFGATTPLVQRFGRHAGPLTTAALLYAGAALAVIVARAIERPSGEAPRAQHAPRLVGVAIAGAVVAPVALAWGLQRTSATSASLLLNFEAVFTLVLAWFAFREPIGRRVAIAALLTLAGGGLLVVRGDSSGTIGAAGIAAVTLATLAWAVDNTLTRPLADLDAGRVVAYKALLGAALTGTAAFVSNEPLPSIGDAIALAACGATGYGLSLRWYLLAQRRVGAARTASLFATAPFLGASIAFALGERGGAWATLGAAALFAIAAALHLTEKHGHAHTHDATTHEHAHTHDDGHHDHAHDPPVVGAHSHAHAHEATTHAHPHAPDLHHAHRH